MSDLDWDDIILHNLGAIAIGIAAGLIAWPIIGANAIWLIREIMQRERKGQPWDHVFTGKQVLWEWVSPSITGPCAMAIAWFL